MNDVDTGATASVVLPALFRSVAPVAIVWGTIVALGFYSHQPGVVCVTPMAWLLAIWTGVQYVKVGSQTGATLSLAGPAIAGLALGIFMAVVWLLGSSALTPPDAPASELEKARNQGVGIAVAGVVACPVFALFGGWLARRNTGRMGA